MAEIPIEKKSSKGWLWALLALLLLALLAWLLLSNDNDEAENVTSDTAVATSTVDTGEATTAQVATTTAGGTAISDVLANPQAFVGRDNFEAEVTVPADAQMTDRGFWVESNGSRLFALINDGPMEEPKDINPGQRLRITQGMLRDSNALSSLPGEPLNDATARIAREQPVFLLVHEDNIEILEAGNS